MKGKDFNGPRVENPQDELVLEKKLDCSDFLILMINCYRRCPGYDPTKSKVPAASRCHVRFLSKKLKLNLAWILIHGD